MRGTNSPAFNQNRNGIHTELEQKKVKGDVSQQGELEPSMPESSDGGPMGVWGSRAAASLLFGFLYLVESSVSLVLQAFYLHGIGPFFCPAASPGTYLRR